MQKFFSNPLSSIANGAIMRTSPVYVQYYVTARCNLRCQQCNVIFANADQSELNTMNSKIVLERLANLGVSVVLFTGGEPFLRSDLPELVQHAISLGIHHRLQTNGLATREQLIEVSEAGARDISISLDSLAPGVQDGINGGFENSFDAALESISLVSQVFPPETFAALGCVFSPSNFRDVSQVVEFATRIGWWVSLVPAHTTTNHAPRAFSTFDSSLNFQADTLPEARTALDEVKALKKQGLNVYDSEQYLDDIYRYIETGKTTWRDRNGGICDSPDSYFAVQPNGDMSVCADYRLPTKESLLSQDFTQKYRNGEIHKLALPVIKSCSGCMYGSFPEISNSLRFGLAATKRLSMFLAEKRTQIRQVTAEDLRFMAQEIRNL